MVMVNDDVIRRPSSVGHQKLRMTDDGERITF